MNNISRISNNEPDVMVIEWVCTNMCNYDCYYCIDELHANTHGFPELEISKQFFTNIHQDVYDGPKFLSLSGGEPTLWKDLAKFYNAITPLNYLISMTTNGSRTVRWWKDFVQECDRIDRIDISIHLAYAKVDHIISVCELLQDYTRVTVMVMMDPNLIDEGIEFIKKLSSRKLRITILLKPLTFRNGAQNVYIYKKEQLEFMESFRYYNVKKPLLKIPSFPVIDGIPHEVHKLISMIANNQHSFTGWWCEMGKKRLVIRYDGTVHPAQCRTARRIKLGSITSGLISQIDGAVCDTTHCDCIPDMKIPKWKL